MPPTKLHGGHGTQIRETNLLVTEGEDEEEAAIGKQLHTCVSVKNDF